MIEDITIRYPQVELYLKSKHLFDVTDLLKDSEGNDREEINIEEFKLALSHVDTQTKSLPATAQALALISVHYALSPVSHISYSIHLLDVRLLHNKVHIFLGVLILERSAELSQKALAVLEVVDAMNFAHFGMRCSQHSLPCFAFFSQYNYALKV